MSHFAQVCERVILHFAELRDDALIGREGEIPQGIPVAWDRKRA